MTIGTNSSGHYFDTTFNTDGVLYSAASGVITSTAVGTATHVLTSNGAGVAPTFQAASASGSVMQINGDTGSATPAAGIITLDANTNSGKTVKFTGSSSTVSLGVTDVLGNTMIGFQAGAGLVVGANSVGIGQQALTSLTIGDSQTAVGASALFSHVDGSANVAVGIGCLAANTDGFNHTCIGSTCMSSLVHGSLNIGIGDHAGSNYTNNESSNIIVGNSGTAGESNVIRIGTQGSGSGQQDECFIAGITGVTTSNSNIVTINTSTGQLGAISGTGGGLKWTDVTGASQTVAVGNGYLSDNVGTVAFTLPASATLGDVFRIVGVQGAWTLAQAANQQIKIGSSATTVGVGGSLASTNAGDCIECVATNTSASTVWRVMSSMGNITVV